MAGEANRLVVYEPGHDHIRSKFNESLISPQLMTNIDMNGNVNSHSLNTSHRLQNEPTSLPPLTPLGQITQQFLQINNHQPHLEELRPFLRERQLIKQKRMDDSAAITNVSIWKHKSSADSSAATYKKQLKQNQYHFFGVQGSHAKNYLVPIPHHITGLHSLLSPVASQSSSMSRSLADPPTFDASRAFAGQASPKLSHSVIGQQQLKRSLMIGDTSVQQLMLNTTQVPVAQYPQRFQNQSALSLSPAHNQRNEQRLPQRDHIASKAQQSFLFGFGGQQVVGKLADEQDESIAVLRSELDGRSVQFRETQGVELIHVSNSKGSRGPSPESRDPEDQYGKALSSGVGEALPSKLPPEDKGAAELPVDPSFEEKKRSRQ